MANRWYRYREQYGKKKLVKVDHAVGHHLPDQNKEAQGKIKGYSTISGQAKHFSGAADASVPRVLALPTTEGFPAALHERAQRFTLHPNAPQNMAPPLGPQNPCAG